MTDKTLPRQYQPERHEGSLYQVWEKGGYFRPEINTSGKPFCIIMPPPNANESLHIGTALTFLIEDVMVRHARMQGRSVLWLPGADHAGIETQVVFERKLEAEGKSRFDFDRETYYQQVMEYTLHHKSAMEQQLRRLGASCDWSRMRFTLDPELVKEVYRTFKQLHDDGLIYKDTRLINWDPEQQTALSDLEVEHVELEDTLYFLDYGPVTIATVRPETVFADVAVALHPDDPRLRELTGKSARIPLTDREIPIIADPAVDPELGSGALKITPGHDPTDYEIGERHELPRKTVIGFDGAMLSSPDVPERYQGLSVAEARKAVVKDLEAAGKLVKTLPYRHQVARAERSKAPIEPLLSEQWFVKMKPLAEPAIRAVRKGEIKIVPKRFEKVFFHWMENIRDWTISRQIWWGIRFPVYYRKGSGEMEIFPEGPPDPENWEQDENTFDTWFSSGQWPYLTLGYPDGEDFKRFYPTEIMETGYDILFFWVARMTMFGLYRTGEIPFRTVYLHGLVRDERGQKMSKSKGNVINPLEMVDRYGSDSLRFALIRSATPGRDSALSLTQIEAGRHFANKLWNVARFVLSRTEGLPDPGLHDRWILSRLHATLKDLDRAFQRMRYDQAAELLYHFLWNDVADWYLEASKEASHLPTLRTVLETSLKMLHPLMPFVTEAIWQELSPGEALIIAEWPKPQSEWRDPEAERAFEAHRDEIRVERVKTALREEYEGLKKYESELKTRLENPDFRSKAPQAVVKESEEKLRAVQERRRKLEELLS